MARWYADTSALVPAFILEPATDRVLMFLEGIGDTDLVISPWVVTEFASALARKRRSGRIDDAVFAEASQRWAGFAASIGTVDVDEACFRRAAAICNDRDIGLTAGDALHLAIALENDCGLLTLDDRLASAARVLGVALSMALP